MIRKARRPSPARPPLLAAFLASCRGVTSVELALTLPVLLAMIFLVIDLQRLS
ncbi:TadE/TadG family type IV pilus assembly protein, partial [Brevundimonas denitrificans]